MIKITNKQIAKGLREYQYYLNGRSSSFYTYLFEAITIADKENMQKIATAYPEYVYAFLDFNGRLSQIAFDDSEE